MGINFRQRNFKIWTILTIAILIVWGVVIWQLYEGRETTKEVLLDLELSRFEEKVESTLVTYEAFSNYIYDQINQDKEILQIMQEASKGTEAEKYVLRSRLYSKLHLRYVDMEKYKFRQLHFHLPTTESFLRVHKPSLSGDLLADYRESVRLANEKQEVVKGFEEGKIYNGFRFVYPLSYEGEHVGTVEVSLSSASIMEVLEKLYVEEDFYFIVDNSAVFGTVFEEELENYRESGEFPGYCTDKEVEEIMSTNNVVIPGDKTAFLQKLNDTYTEEIATKQSFAKFYKYDKENYIVKFSAIENIKGAPVAYLISITKSVRYQGISQDMQAQVLLVTILASIIIGFSLVLFLYQHKLKDTLELDYLTRIYNRKTFYDIVDQELTKFKKCKHGASVLMLDIDHFKKVNDTYGHAFGDEVLQALAKEISANIRETDLFVRWGGEEFIILLPQTNKESTLKVAESIRALIDESTKKELANITISIGVSLIDCDDKTIDSAINRADSAMYCAKNNGRNQVCYE